MLALIHGLISLYILAVAVHALLSWLNLGRTGFGAMLDKIVEPALRPIRRAIGPLQANTGIDFSPAVLILLLALVQAAL